MSERRRQIDAVARVGETAKQAADRIRAGERVRLPPELAQAVDAFLGAGDDLMRLAERELICLEGARDLGGAP